jgi:polysaccharide biosynthesis/export protein
MNTNHTFFRAWPVVKLACVFLASAIMFTGCDTMPSGNSSPKAAVEQAHSEMLILREGDVLKISFPASASLDTVQPIRRDGKLNLPLVGEVVAAGLTPDDLQKKLVDIYASQLDSKTITVQVQSSSFPVYVTGSVIHPGKVMSDHPITALEAIMEAGGQDINTANMKAVGITRNENSAFQHFTINLQAVLNGKDTNAFYLKPGDIVFVPERFSAF